MCLVCILMILKADYSFILHDVRILIRTLVSPLQMYYFLLFSNQFPINSSSSSCDKVKKYCKVNPICLVYISLDFVFYIPRCQNYSFNLSCLGDSIQACNEIKLE